MQGNTTYRKKVVRYSYLKLIGSSALVSIVCCVLAYSLKHSTAYVQEELFESVSSWDAKLFIVLPSIGITAIYFLRKYAFQNRKNKGIKEIYTTLETRKDHLPFFKIPSHYINGFLTVVFGGSTGVEVSTVVASATVGNQAYKRLHPAWAYKTELICAGVIAGVTLLFGSALGGFLFAFEVIARRYNKTLLISGLTSMALASVFVYYLDASPLFTFEVKAWRWQAIPFVAILGLIGGILALYFTKTVIYAKSYFAGIKSNFIRVNLGAITVGTFIFFLPVLYGDSYHGLGEVLKSSLHDSVNLLYFLPLILLVLLKPFVASLTLGAGGDGGVFAPSIVTGALLGVLFAQLCNHYLGTQLVVINFALFGAAAMLSAAIHAPFTAIFIIASLVPSGYLLLAPLLISSFIAKTLAKKLYPYNVYTYKEVATAR
ncbi:chloride channel protein [Sphingobacterium multivorum]|uniref:H(+)/Cl(-) exchange transporter ClcA n=2 Tax=Sphingobacteriaceae TaxID=84566 RepID=A0A654DT48_SPHMU|nr:chloride channel protein [Sphingobacterium multivorum]QQT64609.1 chloride channel protein [Sphingobacterium multivorum]SUJ28835.1 H(+)/Cl(-) exchange transporter ClcA [Sphingobacterium multivorum]VXD05713.1 H(+)/Cl(-) exchange transporter ClcA [Sphingobacterium multivorum]HBI87041.1 chloride channel protein [Sphingobacterium sp.]